MIYFQDTCADVIWDEATRAVVVEWKKFASLEKMQLTLNKSLELLQQKKGSKLLGNSSNMAPYSKEAGDWIAENWIPRALAAGLKSMAYLLPKNAMTRLTMNPGKTNDHPNPSSFESASFDNLEAAKTWLATR